MDPKAFVTGGVLTHLMGFKKESGSNHFWNCDAFYCCVETCVHKSTTPYNLALFHMHKHD